MGDAVATVIVAVVAALGAWFVARFGRVAALEARLAAVENRERRMWVYCRQLIDHGYRHGDGTPPPKPPEDLFGSDDN